jgi:nitrous oxidase accessory protein NosD
VGVSDQLSITAPPGEQLTAFVREKEHEGAVLIRKAQHLGALEAVLLDGEGNGTNAKRLLVSL